MGQTRIEKLEVQMVKHLNQGESIPFDLKLRHLYELMRSVPREKKATLIDRIHDLERKEEARLSNSNWSIDDVPPEILAKIADLEERGYKPYTPEMLH